MAAPLLIALMLSFAQATPPPDTDEDGAPPPATQSQTSAQTSAQTPAATPGQPIAPGQADTPAAPQPLDPLASKPVVRPFEMPAYAPQAPMAYAPKPDTAPDAPVTVEQYQHTYEGAATEEQRYYQAGIDSHFNAEQAMMGSLDGVWTVSDRGGAPLLTLILNDAGGGAIVDGAWRDRRETAHPGSGGGMGVLDAVERDRASLTLTFHAGDHIEPTVLKLKPQADGRWGGEIDDAGARQPVVMNRQPATPAQP